MGKQTLTTSGETDVSETLTTEETPEETTTEEIATTATATKTTTTTTTTTPTPITTTEKITTVVEAATTTEFSQPKPTASKIKFKGEIVKGLIGAKRQAVQLLLNLLELKQNKLETITEETITTAETETNEEPTVLSTTPEAQPTTITAEPIITVDPVETNTKEECQTVDIEVPMEVCEAREVCGPKSRMECNTEYERVCTEQEQELCEPVKQCKTLYKNVCEAGVCSPRLVDECHESDEETCEVVLVEACNELPHKACQLVEKEECG